MKGAKTGQHEPQKQKKRQNLRFHRSVVDRSWAHYSALLYRCQGGRKGKNGVGTVGSALQSAKMHDAGKNGAAQNFWKSFSNFFRAPVPRTADKSLLQKGIDICKRRAIMDVHSNDSSLQSVDEVQVPGRLCARELPVGARQRRSPGETSPLSRRPNRSLGNPSKLCRLAAVILPSRRVCAFVRD